MSQLHFGPVAWWSNIYLILHFQNFRLEMFVYKLGGCVSSVIGGIKVNEDFTQFSIVDFKQRHLEMSDIQNSQL